jgi:hypothetical protein
MKTTLAILIAGLFLLTTPLLALAQARDNHDKTPEHSQSWSNDRHDDHHSSGQRYDQHRNHRVKRVDRHPLRRQVIVRPAPRYERRVYASVPLLLAPPRIVLHFGW